MTETQKRIQELKTAIPHVKEKVVAVASLFAISVAMMASATYAWVTLSRNPQLGGVNTTVSANGNLEIALSGYEGMEPNSSGPNDSFSAQGQTTHGANMTWGNLINLSAGYGLENLVLRPATLNTSYPAWLTGVKYGEDGRVQGTATDYAFTSWGKEAETGKYSFLWSADSRYGVRAISSVGYPPGAGQSVEQQALQKASETKENAVAQYMGMFNNSDYVTALQDLVSKFAQSKLDGAADFDCSLDSVEQLLFLMDDFHTAIVRYGDAMVELANAQIKFSTSSTDKTPYTLDTLMAASAADLEKRGVDLGDCAGIGTAPRHPSKDCLATYKALKNKVKTNYDALKVVVDNAGGTTVKWSQIKAIVNALINVDKVKIAGMTATELNANKSEAIKLLGGGQKPVVISEGTIRDFELLSGARVKNWSGVVQVKVKYLINVTVTGKLQTDLSVDLLVDPPCFNTAYDTTKTKCAAGEYKGELVALDTYGMVLDLWVRSNAPGKDGAGPILVLDGLPKIETHQERRMFLPSGESESVPVFYYERPIAGLAEEGDDASAGQGTEEILVYRAKEADGNYYYYSCVTGNMVFQAVKDETTGEVSNKTDAEGNPIPLTDSDVKEKWDTIKTVVGFESSNRVWKDGEQVLDPDELSATQGSGSCYVFYADTPEESASALELLAHFRLAFISAGGTVMANAHMDVEHVFAENGKYTVPLVVEANALETTTASGDPIYGITQLQQNTATRISVVVYLDGMGLENHMVMSGESIVGSLNLQFATTEDLHSVKDEELSMQTISLSTGISGTAFDYTGSAHTPKLTAYVEGLSPDKVEAIFQRRINATQGTQMEPVVLNNTSGDVWEGNCSFVKPGTYVLKSLFIDGVEYPLPESEWITVTVSGFAVGLVSFCDAPGENLALTTESSVSRDVEIAFNADVDKQPSKVAARFTYKENPEDTNVKYISSTLTYDAKNDVWRGAATFTASGIYTLQYLVLDDEYFELDAGKQKTLTAYLGLRAQVRLLREGGLTFDFTGKEQVGIVADILTDTDDSLMNMENVHLYYTKQGSSLEDPSLTTPLEWTGKAYEGAFTVEKPGKFVFLKMTVGSNELTAAVSASVITCRSKEPPSLDSVLNTQAQIVHRAASDVAYYSAAFSNVDGADGIWAVFEGVTDPIPYKDSVDGTYRFPFPTNQHGNQNGVWTVKEIRVKGVYDAAGNFYGDGEDAKAEYYVLDPKLEGAITTYTVVDVVDIRMSQAVTLNGTFMQQHDLPENFGATVEIKGFEAYGGFEAATGLKIGNVDLVLTHASGSAKDHGGYVLPTSVGTITQRYVAKSDSGVTGWYPFESGDNDKLYYAGTYGSTVTAQLVNAAGEQVTQFVLDDSTGIALTVKSAAPTVIIDSVNPVGTVNIDKGNGGSGYTPNGGVNSVNSTGTAASVYIVCKQNESKDMCGNVTYSYSYTASKVIVRLTNKGAANKATLTFSNGTSYEWTSDGICERAFGTVSGESKTAAGKGLTANKLVLTYGGQEYSFDITTLTVDNEY